MKEQPKPSADSKERYEFKKQVQALQKFQGRGTELISVYVTPGYPLSEITAKLRDEYGQAANIKSKPTQKNVQAALEKIMSFLKAFKQTPENGFAVFAGNVSRIEGKTDMQLFSIEPPMPLNVQFYRCESKFVTEPLEELMEQTGVYGLVVLDGKEATVATLKGKKTRVVKKLHSTAHQKVHKGGQSAARYDRLHTENVELYYKRIGEAMDAFLNYKNFKGVIVGGPGPAKQDFVKMKPFNYQLKILGVADIGYTDEYGLHEVVEKTADLIAEQEAVKEKRLVTEFLKEVVEGGLAVYGFQEILQALQEHKVARLLVSEGLELKKVELECGKCGKTKTHFVETPADEACSCGGKLKVKGFGDAANELVGLAEEQGVHIEFISQDTIEGSQFLATFKGIGAFLRYK